MFFVSPVQFSKPRDAAVPRRAPRSCSRRRATASTRQRPPPPNMIWWSTMRLNGSSLERKPNRHTPVRDGNSLLSWPPAGTDRGGLCARGAVRAMAKAQPRRRSRADPMAQAARDSRHRAASRCRTRRRNTCGTSDASDDRSALRCGKLTSGCFGNLRRQERRAALPVVSGSPSAEGFRHWQQEHEASSRPEARRP